MTDITANMEWSIVSLEHHTVDQQHGVIFTVHWSLAGQQSADLVMHHGYTYGSIDLEYNPTIDFTPVEELTKEQLLSWVWGKIDKNQHEQVVQREIDSKISPLTQTMQWID